MSKSNVFENDMLGLIFCAQAISNIADNAASAPSTVLWFSLHTADPAESSAQGTSETNYTGYTRTSVARTTGGFVVSSGSVSPVAAITFPQATSTSTGTLTHFAVGLTSASSSGKILYSGTISPNVNFGQNITPQLTTASSFTED